MKTLKLLCTILTSILILSSCSGIGNGANNTEQSSAKMVETTTPDYLETLPIKSFEGKTFSMIGPENSARQTFALEAEDGEPVNDALYQRDRWAEEKYNVQIKTLLVSNVQSTVQAAVLAGDAIFDVVLGPMRDTQKVLVSANLAYDLTQLPYLSLEKPWWCKTAYETLKINGKVYTTTGCITPQFYFAPVVMAYNQNIAKNHNLNDINILVTSGNWVYDTFLSYLKNVSEDLNGDGKMSATDDKFAFACETVGAQAFYVSLGQSFSVIGDDNIIKVDLSNSGSINIINKISSLFTDKTITIDGNNSGGNKYENTVFVEGRALFIENSISNMMEKYRVMEDDYSIIPIPKYDEKQDSYRTYANPWGLGSVSVPMNTADPEMTAYLMEVLGYKSYQTVRLAQYDVTLKQKVSRNSDTELILDIIYDNIYYDLNGIFDFGGSVTLVNIAIREDPSTFLSSYAAIEEKIKSSINTLQESLK